MNAPDAVARLLSEDKPSGLELAPRARRGARHADRIPGEHGEVAEGDGPGVGCSLVNPVDFEHVTGAGCDPGPGAPALNQAPAGRDEPFRG